MQFTLTAQTLRTGALHVARSNIGFGEQGANNSGPFLHAIGGKDGENWCALFAGYGYRRTYELAGLLPPPWLYRPGTGRPEPGALRLAKAVAAVKGDGLRGVWLELDELDQALPGDLILLDRPGAGHHIGMLRAPVEEGIARTIEGNVGHFPARVRELTRDVANDPQFVAVVGIREL